MDIGLVGVAVVEWIVQRIVRCVIKVKPPRWMMLVGEIPGWPTSCRQYGVVHLLRWWSLVHVYGDGLRMVDGPEQTLQALGVGHQGQNYQKAATEAVWPILCVIRDLPLVEAVAQRETKSTKEELV